MRADETALCQSCGLCCDGTLFGRVPLTEHDVAPALANVQTTATGGRFIPQRCAALEGTSCRCYGERPTACRQFECTLLVALRDGEKNKRNKPAKLAKLEVRAQFSASILGS